MAEPWTCWNRNPLKLPDWFVRPKQSAEQAWMKLSKRISDRVCSIYYPCCCIDRFPEKVFPNAQVLYLDNNPNSFKNDQSSVNKIVCDAHNFVCFPKVDLWVLINPVIFPNWFLDSVKPQGYIIANNSHWTAKKLKNNYWVSFIWCESLKTGWWIWELEASEYLKQHDPDDIYDIFADNLYLFQKN